MGTRDLPDMYALSPRACGPRALGIHIRQIPRAHVTTIKYITMYECVIVVQFSSVINFVYVCAYVYVVCTVIVLQ